MAHLGFSPFDDVEHLYWRCRSVMMTEQEERPASPMLSPISSSITAPAQDAAQ
jgi:hypothetical protein